ncbi:hypothetical protein LPB67_10255 [Undibacterium sp. Jales W-56]|uniref:hypothetical protein n=1 Tax=Undibacterium sp. Jales W-56 TaxID=2897325 RepID=UPI0021D1AF7B|nr:hypothetical protein [Undibacterium sp. Jales W-56]MCU6434150.1 hypothetical protein [Undibacterium sp. Jales W-56]
MTIQDQQTENDGRSLSELKSELAPQFPGEARRRFTKAGLATTGVLVTMASRPVLGCTTQSPSGFQSGNQSHRGVPQRSNACPPAYWAGTTHWPSGLKQDNPNKKNNGTKFQEIFTDCAKSSKYYGVTCSDLVAGQSFDSSNYYIGMHLMAAYLNSLNHWTPFLTTQKIRDMFTQWQSKGKFSPSSGVYWNAAQIVTYLKATWT